MKIENSQVENNSPEERGTRLKLVRDFVKLGRAEFCEKTEQNLSTYKGWEQGRFGGLTQKGAEKIVSGLVTIGIACSLEWLLNGTGSPPYFLNKNPSSKKEEIIDELVNFEKNYQDAVFIKVSDDSMLPLYEKGDFVAGIKVYNENIDKALNRNCIVKAQNQLITVRYLRKSNKKDYFYLLPINIEAENPIGIEVEIDFAAPVVRHYKSQA